MNIQIKNGKALYEGLEIENFEIDLLKLYQSGPDQCPEWKEDVGDCGKSTCIFCQVEAFMNNTTKDGIYPLPENWEVVKEYWWLDSDDDWMKMNKEFYDGVLEKYYDRRNITARLVRKEQPMSKFPKRFCTHEECPTKGDDKYGSCESCIAPPLSDTPYKEQTSAHGYTEGADITEQTHYCGQCGKPLTLVRPGKHQCDNPDCESNRASIGPLNDKKLSIDLSIKKVENLRKEFAQVLRNGITFAGQIGDYLINESVFEWIENRIGRQSNAPTKEELRKEFIDYYVNKREDQSMLDSLNHLFEIYYSQLQQRDRQINTLKDEVNDLEHDIAIKFEEIDRLKRALAEMDEQAELAHDYNKLKTEEVEGLKKMYQGEIKRISDIYQSVIDELKKKYESPA